MVQSSKGVTPSTRTPRVIVLDEDLFRIFTHYCYVDKYGKPARKKSKTQNLTFEILEAHCKTGAKAEKDVDYHMPDRNKIRLWARQIEWNLLYYKNTPFGNEHSPNPFEELDGLPYFPYIEKGEAGKPQMVDVVAAKRKPIDEVYAQHMFSRKQKSQKSAVSEEHKQSVIQSFRNQEKKRERPE